MHKKYWIVIILAIVVIGGGIFWYKQAGKNNFSGPKVTNIDRHLTPEQQKIYTDRIQKSEEYLRSLKKDQPNFAQEQSNTYVYLAQQYYGLGDLKKANELFNDALKAEPKSESALAGLATLRTEAGDTEGASQLYEKALDANPNNPDMWIRYIELRTSAGASTADLQGLYDQALGKTEHHVNILTKYAQFEEQKGNVDKAVVLWEEAITKNPDGKAIYQAEINRLKNK